MLRAPANPFNKSPIVTTLAALRSCGRDLKPQISLQLHFSCSGLSAVGHDTDRRQENGCLKSLEDRRDLASVPSNEWAAGPFGERVRFDLSPMGANPSSVGGVGEQIGV